MLSACVLIVLATFALAALCEALSYALVYRTDDYQQAKEKLMKLDAKLERNTVKEGSKWTAEQGSETRRLLLQKMMGVKTKTAVLAAAPTLLAYYVLHTVFERTVVGALPFLPFPWLLHFTQNIGGGSKVEKQRHVGVLFVFVLSIYAVRSNVSKYFRSEEEWGRGRGAVAKAVAMA